MSTNLTLVRATVSDLATYLASQITSVTETTFEALLLSYVDDNADNTIPLSSISPDYEQNKSEMETLLLSSENGAWNVQAVAGVGATLINMIATGQTMNQLAIELSLKEAFVQLAQQPSSIYAGTNDLGLRISRYDPASCQVSLTTTDTTIIIPPYSSFSISGYAYYNRDQIFWETGTPTATFTLYQGSVSTAAFTSTGDAYQTYQFGNSDFTIANDDITVTVGTTTYTRATYTNNYTVGLWEYDSTDTVYVENTTPTGNAEITFGNGINGVIPSSNLTIEITYVTTLGATGNVDLSGQTVSYTDSSNSTITSGNSVSGIVSTTSTGGQNNRDSSEYKILSPGLYPAKYRPVTLNDYNAFACQYSGVIDAYFQGQQQLAPNDPLQAMIVKCTLLTSSTWDSDQLTAFTNWLTGSYDSAIPAYAGANIYVEASSAVAVPLDVVLNIYCFNSANFSYVKSLVITAINALFTPRIGYLGWNMTVDDIAKKARAADPDDIDYIDVISPTSDTSVTYNQYVTLNSLTVNVLATSRRNIST